MKFIAMVLILPFPLSVNSAPFIVSKNVVQRVIRFVKTVNS